MITQNFALKDYLRLACVVIAAIACNCLSSCGESYYEYDYPRTVKESYFASDLIGYWKLTFLTLNEPGSFLEADITRGGITMANSVSLDLDQGYYLSSIGPVDEFFSGYYLVYGDVIMIFDQSGREVNHGWLEDDIIYMMTPQQESYYEVTYVYERRYKVGSAPEAVFTIFPEQGDIETEFIVDASESLDEEDHADELEVRWNWDNDNRWDTPYSLIKLSSNSFDRAGDYSIILEVRDTDGNLSTVERVIVVSDASD